MLFCCKYVVLFYNFLFWLLGIIILGFSAYLWWDSQYYIDLNDIGNHYAAPFIVLLVLGGVMTIVGFLGCCGAVRESTCLLGIYFLFCITMCVTCGAALFWAFQNNGMVLNRIYHDTQILMQFKYGTGNTNATELLVDRIQHDFECCGWEKGPIDWEWSAYNNRAPSTTPEIGISISSASQTLQTKVPPSCCKVSTTYCPPTLTAGVIDQTTFHTTSCLKKFKTFVQEKWWFIWIIGGVLIGVQVFALIISCALCCAISRSEDK